jgi:DNA recombination protein RmuC
MHQFYIYNLRFNYQDVFMPLFIMLSLIVLCNLFLGILILLQRRHHAQLMEWQIRWQERDRSQQDMRDHIFRMLNEHQQEQHLQRIRFDEHQLNSLKMLQDSLQKGMTEIRQLVTETLNQNADIIGKRMDKLTQDTDLRLKEISGQVEKRLSEGFEKTTNIFTDVIKRLALIDEAQKKITELSGNVVSLQEILSDKRSRGAFGEVQLAALIRNILPEQSFALQHTLSNGKRADCMLFLPDPTGHIAIDAKFPLESFQKYMDIHVAESERQTAKQQFRADIRKHIQDIAEKYIIANETSDGAVMFIPAEAIFAEIHAHYPELVEAAHRAKVWMVSPTTMMAILTTARAVLKDDATRKQVHLIQEHLGMLSKDFERFQSRIENLAKHIEQAHKDAEAVQVSSKKITSRFSKIEKVELSKHEQFLIEPLTEDTLISEDD